MEIVLQDKSATTIQSYKEFVHESELDLQEAQKQASDLRNALNKETTITKALEREYHQNERDINQLEEEFKKHKYDLDTLNFEHDKTLKELENVRSNANYEIKRLSQEYTSVQSDINVLVLEVKKYEH